MSSRQKITRENAENYFYLETLSAEKQFAPFVCLIEEYNDYLFQDAIRSQNDHIAKTWLLRKLSSNELVAYMSLITDAIKLSSTEKELHALNYPFKTIPAIKIAKLAVSHTFSEKYKGIGSFMIETAINKAIGCNTDYCAARFLTVDADIEHNEGVLTFYEKNGFIPNAELSNKNRRQRSWRRPLVCGKICINKTSGIFGACQRCVSRTVKIQPENSCMAHLCVSGQIIIPQKVTDTPVSPLCPHLRVYIIERTLSIKLLTT